MIEGKGISVAECASMLGAWLPSPGIGRRLPPPVSRITSQRSTSIVFKVKNVEDQGFPLGEKRPGLPCCYALLRKNRQIFPLSPHLQDIVPQADESPFSFDLLQSSKKELREASDLFDLSEYCFHTLFASRVNCLSYRGLQLPSPPLHYAQVVGDSSSGSRLGLF